MTEERKHAILFAATLLCGRRLIESIQSVKPDLSKTYFESRTSCVADYAEVFNPYRLPASGMK